MGRDFYDKEILKASKELRCLKESAGSLRNLRFLGFNDVSIGRVSIHPLGKTRSQPFLLVPARSPFEA